MGILGTILFNSRNMKKAKSLRRAGKEALLALDGEEFFSAVECLCEDAVFDMKSSLINEEQKLVYSLIRLDAEVNNGGLCQFFVNSSSECAPYVSRALEAVGAKELKSLYDSFIADNNIDVNDLSSFKITRVSDYEAQTKRYDFDSFDEKFYRYEALREQIADYARENIMQIMKS